MIPNQWYGVYPSANIKREQAVGLKRFGRKIALFAVKAVSWAVPRSDAPTGELP